MIQQCGIRGICKSKLAFVTFNLSSKMLFTRDKIERERRRESKTETERNRHFVEYFQMVIEMMPITT